MFDNYGYIMEFIGTGLMKILLGFITKNGNISLDVVWILNTLLTHTELNIKLSINLTPTLSSAQNLNLILILTLGLTLKTFFSYLHSIDQ